MDDRANQRADAPSLLAPGIGSPRPPHRLLQRALHRAIVASIICLLLLGVTAAVYLTGGTRFSVLHLAYLPVIAASMLLGTWSGIGAGLLAGLLLGPYMPLDVDTGQSQDLMNWTLRLGGFVLAGAVTGILMAIVRRQQARLHWLALHSPDSGLPNLEALINDLNYKLARRLYNNRYALLLVQINNYEHIINALGAHFGAELRGALARRVQAIRPAAEQVYDMRGNKIAVLLADPDTICEDYVARLRQLPESLLTVSDLPVYTDLAVGMVSVGYEPHTPEALVQRANIAVNEARRHRNFVVRYAYEDDHARQRNMELLTRLPAAIRDDELTLEYQPKIELRSGATIGAEALVRWQHPELGRVSPADFIPLAESTALVHPLTKWVMAEATAYLAGLRDAGRPVSIAINISPRNLEELEVLAHLRELIATRQLNPASIELEITETAVLDASPRLMDTLTALRTQGLKLAIDDFGTGYTSLSYLADLPIDCLKIDQVFVRQLTQDRRQRHIVGSIIDLARSLGLTTVAEGIEDQQTADLLLEMGCDIGQGYHFSRPLPAPAFRQWLEPTESAPAPG